jgi:hypothetical protein
VHDRSPIDPGLRLLELQSYAKQQVFAADRRHEVNPKRAEK